ncbi:MAG: branched-chain amino acid transport system permease protein [Actinomycetota bacterium]|nr:branched-chain amino acid transport system permease protein [Actinomycetota bacterium]
MHRRIMAAIGAVFFALIALFALAQPASADGEQVSGRLENRVDGGRTPVPGVTITVTGGGFTDSTTSGADGKWVIPVPAQGSYDVSIDLSTLPEGIGLTDPDKIVITTTVQPPNLNRIVIFPLGESTAVTNSKWATAAQLAFEGVRFGLLIALGALGLSLIYGTTGLTNFAHGEIITFGALATYTLNAGLGMPLLLAAILGVILTALFGAFQNRGLWKPLRKRGTGLIAMMIVSIGLAILLRNLFLFFYGGDKQAYTEFVGAAGLNFGPVSVTPADIVVIIVSILALGAVVVGVQKTRLGKATRAVSDNPALASSAGIDVERVIEVVWIVGAALAGLGGILLAFTQQVSFQMGFQVLLLVFAAVTLGGLGTIWGAIVGSLVVGLFLQLSTLIIPSELKNVGALLVLIVILLVRPYGLLGRRERVG